MGYDCESIDVAAKPTTQNVEHRQGGPAIDYGNWQLKAQACSTPVMA